MDPSGIEWGSPSPKAATTLFFNYNLLLSFLSVKN